MYALAQIQKCKQVCFLPFYGSCMVAGLTKTTYRLVISFDLPSYFLTAYKAYQSRCLWSFVSNTLKIAEYEFPVC